MSLVPRSSLMLPRWHGLPPCSESSKRIWPLEILKSEEQEGSARSLGVCTLKKCRNIKDSHYFWGKCVPNKKNPVLIRGSVLPFLEVGLDFEVGFSCSSAITPSYTWVPVNPNHQLQAGNFPRTHVQSGLAQGNENGENSLSFLHLSLVAISKGYTCSPHAVQTLPDT